jgi:hypothetical protein
VSFAAVTLEQFADASLLSDAGAEAIDPQAAYLEGFAAGEAAALGRLAEAERAFIDAAQSLDDALKALKPSSERALAEALQAVLGALLPTLAEKGFATEAAGAVARAFAGKTTATATIVAHPSQVEALAAALSAAPRVPAFEIQADENAPSASARVLCGKGGLDFDLNAATEACLSALESACGAMKSGT